MYTAKSKQFLFILTSRETKANMVYLHLPWRMDTPRHNTVGKIGSERWLSRE